MNEIVLKSAVKNAVKEALDEETIKTIRKVQADLIRIENGERFFFNVANYENQGLIKSRDIMGYNSAGNKVKISTEWYLTDKGKRITKFAI